jgi:hypothetical protein
MKERGYVSGRCVACGPHCQGKSANHATYQTAMGPLEARGGAWGVKGSAGAHESTAHRPLLGVGRASRGLACGCLGRVASIAMLLMMEIPEAGRWPRRA